MAGQTCSQTGMVNICVQYCCAFCRSDSDGGGGTWYVAVASDADDVAIGKAGGGVYSGKFCIVVTGIVLAGAVLNAKRDEVAIIEGIKRSLKIKTLLTSNMGDGVGGGHAGGGLGLQSTHPKRGLEPGG